MDIYSGYALYDTTGDGIVRKLFDKRVCFLKETKSYECKLDDCDIVVTTESRIPNYRSERYICYELCSVNGNNNEGVTVVKDDAKQWGIAIIDKEGNENGYAIFVKTHDCLILTDLMVAPHLRNNGFGTRLLHYAMCHSKLPIIAYVPADSSANRLFNKMSKQVIGDLYKHTRQEAE